MTWAQSLRQEGYEEGYQEGVLIGQIITLRELMDLSSIPSESLAQLPITKLQTQVQELKVRFSQQRS